MSEPTIASIATRHASEHSAFMGSRTRSFLRQQTRLAPSEVRSRLLRRYESTEKVAGIRAANLELLNYGDAYKSGLPQSASLEAVRAWASRRANECRLIRLRCRSDETAWNAVTRFCTAIGIEPPSTGRSHGAKLNRACAEKWWRSAGRVAVERLHEQQARDLGEVGTTTPYLSDRATKQFLRRQREATRALQAAAVFNELGESFSLAEAVEHSLANPANRRIETMVRLRGIEEFETERGHRAVFLTWSLPSRFHRLSRKRLNEKYSGATPRDGCQELQRLWSQVRAEFKRHSLSVTGVRVVEPHQDGTPHWHLLLFGQSQTLEAAVRIISRYAMADSPDEAGAKLHRVKTEWIDPTKGTATGYVAKYIAKGLDGHGVERFLARDELGRWQEIPEAERATLRVVAWARLWGVRQFAFIDQPPIGEYRELRRLRDPVADEDLESIRSRAVSFINQLAQ